MSFRVKFLLFMGIVCMCNAAVVTNNATAEYPNSHHHRMPFRSYRTQPQHTQQHLDNPVNMGTGTPQKNQGRLTVSEMQLRKLDSLENRLIQMNSSTNAGLEALRSQQQAVFARLQNIETLQNEVQSVVNFIRDEMTALQPKEDHSSKIRPRQVLSQGMDENSPDLEAKLDSLVTFLTSTRFSIEKNLKELGTSLGQLTELTRAKALLNPPNRQPLAYYNAYGPSQPAVPYQQEPTSCSQAALDERGIQKIRLEPESEAFYVLCEPIEKGGWTVIQNRFDGSINFNRGWEEYKIGFGNLAGEFFIGLEKLHALTASHLHELMIVLVDFKNETRIAMYDSFAIAGEKEYYALNILGKYSGNAGDSFSSQAGNKFSTFDNDNDGWVEGNCAQAHSGPWWHAACESSNLNGQYLGENVPPSQQFQGMYWEKFHGSLYSLKSVQMKIRPVVQ